MSSDSSLKPVWKSKTTTAEFNLLNKLFDGQFKYYGSIGTGCKIHVTFAFITTDGKSWKVSSDQYLHMEPHLRSQSIKRMASKFIAVTDSKGGCVQVDYVGGYMTIIYYEVLAALNEMVSNKALSKT